jgi:hypothetical protein
VADEEVARPKMTVLNKMQEARETETVQMAHPPTRTVQALPENEDAVEKAWIRGSSAVLKVVEKAIREPNICMT